MAIKELWVEKYRPSGIEGYVFKDERMKETVLGWLANPEKKNIPIPHLLLSGVQGTGKTTLAFILCNEMKVEKADLLYINASRNNGIDEVRQNISNFCSTWPMGDFKIVILDEVDGFTPAAQKALRAEMELHSDTARFILTANTASKIIPALHSRVQGFHLDGLDKEGFVTRVFDILVSEDVTFEPEHILDYVEKTFPDMRKCINLLEQNTINGTLNKMEAGTDASLDYIVTFCEMFLAGKYTEARKYLCAQMGDGTYEDVYRYFSKNLELFGDTEEHHNMALITIAEAANIHTTIFDPEINLAACLVNLQRVKET
ncbi:clamp loader of DNA polymerase [Agrobacterium phage Atu_ph07]|uniref:Replication factor C small subunit n=1 Tax=Agrobacterium phage Atu_ph07 TaxID=2024264 RepID=A0A223W0A3_9CAUD|nr:clamp loader of DNA polymerase [Agrobacterium phage Atu_ph07]ASV44741.1 replication factor C small subunit [Agrobacterium phage Atu_ph07]